MLKQDKSEKKNTVSINLNIIIILIIGFIRKEILKSLDINSNHLIMLIAIN